jgi:hypothetical protein
MVFAASFASMDIKVLEVLIKQRPLTSLLTELSKSLVSESLKFSLSLFLLVIKGHSQIIIMIYSVNRFCAFVHNI